MSFVTIQSMHRPAGQLLILYKQINKNRVIIISGVWHEQDQRTMGRD